MKSLVYLMLVLSVFACDRFGASDSGTKIGDISAATENRSSPSRSSRDQQERELERRRQELDKTHPYKFLTEEELDRVDDSIAESRARAAAEAVRSQNQARQAEEASGRACRKACNMSDDYGLCIRRCPKP